MTTPCPGRERLRRLLEESLAAPEQQELQAHLETCAACQQALDRLAADGGTWDRAAAHLGAAREPAGPALRQVVSALRADPPTEGPAQGTRPELPFLDPPAVPGHLGRLGHYEVLEVVGRGGMGIVLKALDERLQRVVAVKVLGAHYAGSASARKRFRREAKAAAAVNHDNVVPIYHVDEVNGTAFLVMPLILGNSLQSHLDRCGPLPAREVVRTGLQVARGLAAAHAQGLVHRDIKPANILLEDGVERVKITDFGLARAVDDVGATQPGVISGTPLFMSPEQARGEDPIDHRSDLFSLGSVLYLMCTDRPPFRASGTHATLRRVIEDTPRPVRELNPEVPAWLEAVIARLLAKDPADRWQSAAEVADLLQRHLAHLQDPRHEPPPTVAPVPAAPPTTPVEKLLDATDFKRRQLQLLGIALGVGLFLLGLASLGTAGVPEVVILLIGSGLIMVGTGEIKQRWEVRYRGHRIRFENSCVFGQRLFIDGACAAWNLLGRPRELHGRIERGDGAGVAILVLLDAEPFHFRCRIFAEPPTASRRAGGGPLPAVPPERPRHGHGCLLVFLGVLGVLVLLFGLYLAQSRQGRVINLPTPGSPPARVGAPGDWVELFNGADLTGWETLPEQSGAWQVEDGMLIGRGHTLSHLFSDRGDLEDFHLRAEVMVNADGEGGVLFRAPLELVGEPDETPPAPMVEITGKEKGRSGGILRLGPRPWRGQAARLRLTRPDTWFTLELIAVGGHYTTKIDGKLAADTRADERDMHPGHLALQVRAPGTILQFRKIEVRRLPPAGE